MASTRDERQVRWGIGLTGGSIGASLSSLLLFGVAVWTDARALALWLVVVAALAVSAAVMAWCAMDLVWSGKDRLYEVAVGAFRLACVTAAIQVVLVLAGALYFTSGSCCG